MFVIFQCSTYKLKLRHVYNNIYVMLLRVGP